jgi:hypothetical protein
MKNNLPSELSPQRTYIYRSVADPGSGAFLTPGSQCFGTVTICYGSGSDF